VGAREVEVPAEVVYKLPVEVADDAVADDEGRDDSLGKLGGEDQEAQVGEDGRDELVDPLKGATSEE
jgi:hypothetical protein